VDVELPELVSRVSCVLQRDPVDVVFVGTTADSELGEGWAVVKAESSNSVSVPAASRLDGPPATLRGGEPRTVLGREGVGKEFVASVDITDGVVSTAVGVVPHLPQLAVIVALGGQYDGVGIISALDAGSEETVTRLSETIDVVFEEHRESHCCCMS